MSEYYMFNKPLGCITARRDLRHKTVMNYFPDEKRDVLFPVGRLDKDTEGFLLVTDDGELCHHLMMPESHIEKMYFFHALCKNGNPFSEKAINLFEKGINIFPDSEALTAPAKLEIIGEGVLSDIKPYLCEKDAKISGRRGELPIVSGYITITEGKKHQVRRMIGYFGARVVFLRRVSINGVMLDKSLPLGEYRSLTNDELMLLKKDIGRMLI